MSNRKTEIANVDSPLIPRREWLTTLARGITAGLITSFIGPATLGAAAPTRLTVYKDPSCGCCKRWVEHLAASGFSPEVRDRQDMDALKSSLGIPAVLRSCHTAVAGRYIIEGHVPASDIRRLLTTAPRGVLGLAVPDMPAGSPGMEMGGRKDRFEVFAFDAGGNARRFAAYG